MFNRIMVGSNDIERSKRFYDAVLGTLGTVAHGGQSIEHSPGLRESSLGAMYLAHVRDPDGNKLCAIHRVK